MNTHILSLFADLKEYNSTKNPKILREMLKTARQLSEALEEKILNGEALGRDKEAL